MTTTPCRLSDCLKWLEPIEGGYVDDKDDRGGCTNKGITQTTYDVWRLNKHLPMRHVKELSKEEHEAIYATYFYNPIQADKLPKPLDLCVFDAAVQHGVGRSSKWLQRVVSAYPDGVIGSNTIKAVEVFCFRNGLAMLVNEYLSIRERFYKELIANDPSQKKFEKGWDNRMKALRKELEK